MFPLSKIYVWASLFGAMLAALVLSAVYHHFSVVNLKDIGERDTVALTQTFANTLGPELVEWVGQAASMPADEIKEHEQTQQLLAQARQQMRGTDVSKIKIYALNGRTVFSSELKQIGEDKSANEGFLAARAGKVATELTYRDKFSAFERVIQNRNLLSTYLPIRDQQTARVVVVFELYNDVTELLEEIKRTGELVMGAVVLVLALVFGALIWFVRHAERKLCSQYERLQSHSIELSAGREELELKVSELTAQLENTHAGMSMAWESARQADQGSSQMLSSIAHVIREPLDGIVQAGRLLGESRLDMSQRNLLDRVLVDSEVLRKSMLQMLERANAHHLPPAAPQFSVPVKASEEAEPNSEVSSPGEIEFKLG